MSYRTREDILRAKEKYNDLELQDALSNLPPGYIAGGDMEIDGTDVTIGPLVANINGKRVEKTESTNIQAMSWVGAQLPSTYYYIYLDRIGFWTVETVEPVLVPGFYGWYMPETGARFIGQVYVNSDGSITDVVSHHRIRTNDIETSSIVISGLSGAGTLAGLDDIDLSYVTDAGDLAALNTINTTDLLDDEVISLAKLGNTIIEGGYVKTTLINTSAIVIGDLSGAGTLAGLDDITLSYVTDAGALAANDTINSTDLIDDNVVELAKLGTTVISGGYLVTSLISVSTFPSLNDESLEAYWSFDDGTSGSADGYTATDNSGNGNDATIHGCTWTTGVSGKALQFNGTDDYVSVSSFTVGATFAFSCSFKISTLSDAMLMSHVVNYMRVTVSGNLFMSWRDSGGTQRTLQYAAGLTADDTWHSAVVSHDGTTAKIFLDGILVTSDDTYDCGASASNTLYIGRFSSGFYFNGDIDEPRTYSKALTDSQVKYLYLNPGGPAGRTVISGNSLTTGTITAVNINLNDVFQVDGSTGIITYAADEVELGSGADASGTHSVAVGKDAGGDGVASSGDYSVAIGDRAHFATADRAVAIGYYAGATNVGSISIGRAANVTGQYGVGVGEEIDATGDRTVAIGYYADATAYDAIGIGNHADASAIQTIAIGNYADADATSQLDLNTNNLNLTAFYFASGTKEDTVYTAITTKMGSGDQRYGIIGLYQNELCKMYKNTSSNDVVFYDVADGTSLTIDSEDTTTGLSYDLKFMVLY